MKTFGFILLALALALTATPALAQEACKTTFDIVGKDDNKWYVGTAANPTLTACPLQSITINANVESGVHNINVRDVTGAPAASDAIDEGGKFAYTFMAPASGAATYVCEFHASTMKGAINFAQTGGASPTQSTGNGEDNDSPGFGLLAAVVALAGIALVMRRK